MKHINHFNILLKLTLLGFMVSCGSHKNMVSTQPSIENDPRIIFLNYSIKKSADGNRNIRFINKIITEGSLKKTVSKDTGVSGDLICTQFDKKNKVLERILVKNPMSKNMEFLDGSKTFQRKQIALDSTQFSIRLQLKSQTKYISISDFSAFESNQIPLIKTQIH